jgi:hypothetical protein
MSTNNPRIRRENYLDAIHKQRIQIRELSVSIAHCVAAARDNGATWGQIGEALETTKQAAQQRYGLTWPEKLLGVKPR